MDSQRPPEGSTSAADTDERVKLENEVANVLRQGSRKKKKPGKKKRAVGRRTQALPASLSIERADAGDTASGNNRRKQTTTNAVPRASDGANLKNNGKKAPIIPPWRKEYAQMMAPVSNTQGSFNNSYGQQNPQAAVNTQAWPAPYDLAPNSYTSFPAQTAQLNQPNQPNGFYHGQPQANAQAYPSSFSSYNFAGHATQRHQPNGFYNYQPQYQAPRRFLQANQDLSGRGPQPNTNMSYFRGRGMPPINHQQPMGYPHQYHHPQNAQASRGYHQGPSFVPPNPGYNHNQTAGYGHGRGAYQPQNQPAQAHFPPGTGNAGHSGFQPPPANNNGSSSSSSNAPGGGQGNGGFQPLPYMNWNFDP